MQWLTTFCSRLCWLKVISQFFGRLCGFSAEIARYQVGGECPGMTRAHKSRHTRTYMNRRHSVLWQPVHSISIRRKTYKEQILAFPVAVVCGRSGRYTVAGGKPSLLQCRGGGAVGLQLYRKHSHCERLGTCRSCRPLSSGCSG